MTNKEFQTEKSLEVFKKIFEKKGSKFTKQKQRVLKILVESKIHLNAEEIYNKLKYHKIGLATVYRSLKQFDEFGIVKEININGISYYEMKIYSKKPLHIHFKCLKCNDIIDIDDNTLNFEYIKLNNQIQAEKKLDIYDIDILLKGLCSKCREVNE